MRSDAERLLDIVDAAERIESRVSRGRQYLDEEDAAFALVHLITVIGEACSALSPDLRHAHPEVPWQAARRTRNRLMHGYFDVDLDVVWATAVEDVPALAAGARRALEALQQGVQQSAAEP